MDDAERDRLWEEWLSDPERTEKVREVARKYPPWHVYFNVQTGQKAQIVAYAEDGTVSANCWRDELGEGFANLTMVQVFGIDPSDLTLSAEGNGEASP